MVLTEPLAAEPDSSQKTAAGLDFLSGQPSALRAITSAKPVEPNR